MDLEKQKPLSQEDKKLIEAVSKTWGNYCPSCGQKKAEDSIRIFKKTGPLTQLVSECDHCGMKTLVSAMPNLGMQVNQIRTDISSQEFESFTTPVSSQDYLDFYNEVQRIRNTEDLLKLINKGK